MFSSTVIPDFEMKNKIYAFIFNHQMQRHLKFLYSQKEHKNQSKSESNRSC